MSNLKFDIRLVLIIPTEEIFALNINLFEFVSDLQKMYGNMASVLFIHLKPSIITIYSTRKKEVGDTIPLRTIPEDICSGFLYERIPTTVIGLLDLLSDMSTQITN